MAKLLTEDQYNELQAILRDGVRLALEITGGKDATIDELLQMVRDLKADRSLLADYKEVHEDKQRLMREIDQIINGNQAAKQASLCDLIPQIKELVADRERLEWIESNYGKSDKILMSAPAVNGDAPTLRQAIDWARNHG